MIAVLLMGALISPATSRAAEEACTSEEARVALKDFVSAYNRGHLELLDSMWAKEPKFEWYTVGPGPERLNGDRSNLIAYFAERHELGDRMDFLRLKVLQGDTWHGGRDFNYTLRRTSDDLWPSADGVYEGKGAMSARCKFFVWTMSWSRP
ncbi:MAG: hypothetical protein M3N53_08540 [Actinomycetota bacterium]|nr:hypothetical protein [Actinomycetota bacterium]